MWSGKSAFQSINTAFIGVLVSAALSPWLLKQDSMLKWSCSALIAAVLLFLVVRCIKSTARTLVKVAFGLTILAYLASVAMLTAWGWSSDSGADTHTVTLLIVMLILLGLSSYVRRDEAVVD